MKSIKSKVGEGDKMRVYLKQHFDIGILWKKLGYSTRQGMYFQLGKEVLTEDFKYLLERKLNINVDLILYGNNIETENNNISERDRVSNSTGRTPSPLINKGLTDENQILTLSSPTRVKLLKQDNTIEFETFTKALPTKENTNFWVPIIGSIEELIELEGALKKHGGKKPIWPMEADEIIRNPKVNAQISVNAPPCDNMYPLFKTGEIIYITYVDKYKYKPGVVYLVIFQEGDYMLYYISEGKTDHSVRLYSEKRGVERDYPMDGIKMIFAVSPRV